MLHTINDLLARAVARQPDRTAVIHNDSSLTYSEICSQACKLAAVLNDMGVGRGDRVCCFLEKRLEKVIVVFAVSLAGAVFVPVRWVARPHQAAHVIDNSGSRVLITTSQKFSLLKKTLQRLTGAVILDGTIESTATSPAIRYWHEIMADRGTPWQWPDIIAQDIAAILYTSGSSGMPKGVVLTHGNIIAGANTVAQYLEINEHDRLLSYLSFGFDYGLNQLMTSFLRYSQLILFDYLFPRDILRAVERYQATGLAAVSTTWIQLLQVPWGDTCRSLRYVTNSGGSIPVRLVRELRRRLPQTKIFLMYGLTEAFRSTYLDPAMVDERPGSIGKAVPGEEIMVLDSNKQPVKPGETGELVHRGALVTRGYWGDSKKSRQIFRPNPLQPKDMVIPEMVVYSGDYVRIDTDGYLYFEGRKDDMIKSAGNRISPTEVEEILYNSGMIADAVAFGVPHEIYGQSICAVVSSLPETQVTPEQLAAYCRDNMPAYMVPTRIEIQNALPLNANGKLDRAAIRAQFAVPEEL